MSGPKVSCNNGHIAIGWNHPGACPLCACFKEIERLRQVAKDALELVEKASTRGHANGYEEGRAAERADVAGATP